MKKLLKDKRIIVVILAIIAFFLLIDFNQRMGLLIRLRGQERVLIDKYSQLESTRSALETAIAYSESDEAVEKWAREEAGMIQPGDIPIVLLPPSTPAAPEPLVQERFIEEVHKWQIWQELFFGD
jgi:cell division protein FtsB